MYSESIYPSETEKSEESKHHDYEGGSDEDNKNDDSDDSDEEEKQATTNYSLAEKFSQRDSPNCCICIDTKHKERITCVLSINNTIITGSRDKTIKKF